MSRYSEKRFIRRYEKNNNTQRKTLVVIVNRKKVRERVSERKREGETSFFFLIFSLHSTHEISLIEQISYLAKKSFYERERR